MVANCMRDLECFLGGEAVFDDQTLMWCSGACERRR